MSKVKKVFQNMFQYNKGLKVLSVVLAVIVWFIIAIVVDPEGYQTIYNVEVNISVRQEQGSNVQMAVVSNDVKTVSIRVRGKRYVIGSLTADDFEVTGVVNAPKTAGQYTVELTAKAKNANSDYTIEVVSPKQTQVQVDVVETRAFVIEPEVIKATPPQSSVIADAIASPTEVKITGPQQELDKIAKVTGRVNVNSMLEQTVTLKADIVLYDASGAEIIKDDTLKVEYKTVDVTIPVMTKITVPLSVEFTNVPPQFPLDQLKYKLSVENVELAVSKGNYENLSSLNVGYIDLRNLDVDTSFDFNIPTPKGAVNLSSESTVHVSIELGELSSKTFTVGNLTLVNKPDNYEVRLNTAKIYNVKIVGKADVLRDIQASDIVAQVDLSTVSITTNQVITAPVQIVLPNGQLAWGVGSYSAVVTAKPS